MFRRLLCLLLLAPLCVFAPAQAQNKPTRGQWSGRAAFVFTHAIAAAGLKAAPCPGRMGNATTRCALGKAGPSATRKRLNAFGGWTRTDPWKGDTAGFTSDGTDGFVVTVMGPIGRNTGSLLIFSEY